MKIYIQVIIIITLLVACSKRVINKPELIEVINSTSVAFKYIGAPLEDFFLNPSKAYISGYFYFEDNLADGVIFGLDIECNAELKND